MLPSRGPPQHLQPALRNLADRLLEGVRGFVGNSDLADDMTLLVLRVLERTTAGEGDRRAGAVARTVHSPR